MIPQLNHSGVLPPFLPNVGETSLGMAPYHTSITELATKFCSTPDRKVILEGLLKYRELLRNEGIIRGFQWLDGSYIEDCENLRGRPPHDIDIVTFAERPSSLTDNVLWVNFVASKAGTLFARESIKKQYLCDAYYVDLNLPTYYIISSSRYWFGMFSHQRVTYIWKGLLQIPLQSDDEVLAKAWGV